MENAEIGLIGLGGHGLHLALNIAEKGNKIAVFNRTPEKTDEFYESAGDLKKQIIPCKTIEEFVDAIRPAAADHHHDQGGRCRRPADGGAAPRICPRATS